MTTFDFEFNWDFNPMVKKNQEFLKLTIHYDKLFNNDNEMELSSLAKSWQGLAKVLIGLTNLSVHGRIDPNSSNIKVTTKAELKKGSIITTVWVYVQNLDLFDGAGTALLSFFLGRFLSNRKSKQISSQEVEIERLSLECKNLKDQISDIKKGMDNKDELIKKQSEIIEEAYKALLYSRDQIKEIKATSQKQADEFNLHLKKLNSSGRSFLNPVNTECEVIEGLLDKKVIFSADSETKELFIKQSEIVDVTNCTIELRKLDKKNGSCTVIYTDPISSKEIIIPATITDLKFFTLNNDYLDSFANRSTNDKLKVNGQLIVNEEGVPIRLNIQEISKIS